LPAPFYNIDGCHAIIGKIYHITIQLKYSSYNDVKKLSSFIIIHMILNALKADPQACYRLQLVFHNSVHHLQSLMSDSHDCPASSLKVLGQPLIVRNVEVACNVLDIDEVMIPDNFSNAATLIQDNFPSLDVQQFSDDNSNRLISNQKGKLDVPLNTFIDYSLERGSFLIDTIMYPWDFLYIMQRVMQDKIVHTTISPNASVDRSSIIDGPCIIEDGVTIDDFCKIKGPTYIGSGSFIGMGSLVRKCMIGEDTTIGFNCEIGKSYFAGNNDKLAHHNVILDSIIGKNVWFGGYSGTANALLNKQSIRYEINGKLVDTGTDHFGAVVGNDCAIGASVIILPGRQVPSNSIVQAGTIFGKKQ
jgi:UDP-N-acetylglucosamine diphosphorylase / glucose-1-phosphate thymidylyltransferase / UDP-N-acetylgalactosamine diphosphorylase / glucosamine-1-phosphate N-acetyltransferase / galactosamine-1-phosphate N-acetyltransferase